MSLPIVLATAAAPIDPVPQGDPVATIKPPTSQNLRDYAAGLTAQAAVLDAIITDYTAEISELDARRLKLVADKTKATAARDALKMYAQGAANWATVVKP